MKFKSQVFTAVSGSVGGLTYSHNKYGMYTRGRAVPVNPNSTRQAAIRAAFSSMVDYWHLTLTGPERAAWDVYAANTPVTDSLGQTQYLTGQSMFLRANTIRQWLALTIIDAAPVVYDLGQPVTALASVVVAAGTISFTYTIGGAGTPTTARKIIGIGVAQNVGRTFFGGPYQHAIDGAVAASVTAAVSTALLASSAQWKAAYQPIVGDFLPVTMRMAYDDGRVSVPFRQLITVT